MAPILSSHLNSPREKYIASAPGSLFLFGEHAVLQNKRAIVLAVDKRITVRLEPRADQLINITSPLGELKTNLHSLKVEKPFQFVLAAIRRFKAQLKQGFDLFIHSEFSSEVGLGSSAAVTVATIAVLAQLTSEAQATNVELLTLFEMARSVIQEVQGIGSGADIAASVFGGVIVYQQFAPFILKMFSTLLPFVVIYSGYKTPTPEVVDKVEKSRQQYPMIFKSLYEAIDQIVLLASTLIEQENWREVGKLMDIQQGIMNALGVSTPLLNNLVETLKSTAKIYGAKISGSGLGDCVIGIGEFSITNFPPELAVSRILVTGALQGVTYE